MPGPGLYDHTRVSYRPKPGAPFTAEERASLDRLAKTLKSGNIDDITKFSEDEMTQVADRPSRSEFLQDGSFQLSKLINMSNGIGPDSVSVIKFAHNLLLERTSATVVNIPARRPEIWQIRSAIAKLETWKKLRVGPLILAISTGSDNTSRAGHRTVVVYVDGHDGIYMDSNGQNANMSGIDHVQKMLTKTYGLPPVAPPACGRAIQGIDNLCLHWSNVLAFLVDAGFTPESAADFLYDTGVLGLQAYAAMVCDSDAINDKIVDPSIPGRLAPWPIFKAGEDAWRFRLVPGDSPGWDFIRGSSRAAVVLNQMYWTSRLEKLCWKGWMYLVEWGPGGCPFTREEEPPGTARVTARARQVMEGWGIRVSEVPPRTTFDALERAGASSDQAEALWELMGLGTDQAAAEIWRALSGDGPDAAGFLAAPPEPMSAAVVGWGIQYGLADPQCGSAPAGVLPDAASVDELVELLGGADGARRAWRETQTGTRPEAQILRLPPRFLQTLIAARTEFLARFAADTSFRLGRPAGAGVRI